VGWGFEWIERIDIYENFSPIIKRPTIQVVVALASQQQWEIKQFNVHFVFLHT
jgi:hypothetical protein